MGLIKRPILCKKHGQITDLSEPFSLGNEPFTVMAVPKTLAALSEVVTIQCKCVADLEAAPLPIVPEYWTDAQIMEIETGSLDLEQYDLFWAQRL